MINLLWKLGLGLGLESELHYISIFHGELRKRAPSANFTEGNIWLKERTQTMNNNWPISAS